MRKIYLSALAIIAGVSVSAQVSNASFENWAAGEPVDWSTFNFTSAAADITDGSGTTISPAAEVTTGATNGSKYVKLTSFNVANTTDPGNVPDGVYGAILQQEFNSSSQYADFKFDVKYDIKPNDTAIIAVQAYNAGGQLAGIGIEVFAGSQATFNTISIPMQYADAVVEYVIIVSSSEGQVLQGATSTVAAGSWLALDNIVVGNTVSITEEVLNSTLVNVYPNPANSFVNFKVEGVDNAIVTISSITGQEVVNTTIANGTTKVDVSNLNNGVYIYTVRNQNGEVVKTNKLVVRK